MKDNEMEKLTERIASKLFEKIMKYIAIAFVIYLVAVVGSFGFHEFREANRKRIAKLHEEWLNEPVYYIENDRAGWQWVFTNSWNNCGMCYPCTNKEGEEISIGENIAGTIEYLFYCGMWKGETFILRNFDMQHLSDPLYIIAWRGSPYYLYEYEIYEIAPIKILDFLENAEETPIEGFWRFIEENAKLIKHDENEEGWSYPR